MTKIIEILKTIAIPVVASILFFLLGKKSKELEQEKSKNKVLDRYNQIDSKKVEKSDIYKADKW